MRGSTIKKYLAVLYREDGNEASGVLQAEKLLDKVRLSISQERVRSKEVATLRAYRTPTLIVTMLIENRLVSLLPPERTLSFPCYRHTSCQMIGTYLQKKQKLEMQLNTFTTFYGITNRWDIVQ